MNHLLAATMRLLRVAVGAMLTATVARCCVSGTRSGVVNGMTSGGAFETRVVAAADVRVGLSLSFQIK
jgi:hypothetical protein